jgi:hypothetical protein
MGARDRSGGVDRRTVHSHLEVQMWARRVPGGANRTDPLPGCDASPDPHVEARQVRVHRADATTVSDCDEVAVPARMPRRVRDAPGTRGEHGPSGGGGEVESGVESNATRPKPA